MPVRALEFYSGIGGLHFALSRSRVDAQVIEAFDWDQTACLVYRANHGDIVRKVDISTLNASDLSSLKSNLWLLSPACQPYTVLNPSAKGEHDPRALSFIHLIQNILPELASSDEHPERLLVENVCGFESSSTRHLLLSTLRSIGYTTLELLLTPLQFGIPNSRLRYYLLAKKSPLAFTSVPDDFGHRVWRQIPGLDASLVIRQKSTLPIREYLDDVGTELLSVPDRVLEKWGRLFDIVLPCSQRTCCFTRGYTQLVERAGSILQENEELDTTKIFDSFLEAQSRGEPDAVKLLHPLRLRYFSPSELLRIFAFEPPAPESQSSPSSFQWPSSVSRKAKYRLIGNSVNVKVVEKLIHYLYTDPI